MVILKVQLSSGPLGGPIRLPGVRHLPAVSCPLCAFNSFGIGASPTFGRGNQLGTTIFLNLLFTEHNVGVYKQDKVYYYCEISLEVDLTRLRERYRLLGRGRVLLLRPPAAAFHLPVRCSARTGEGEGRSCPGSKAGPGWGSCSAIYSILIPQQLEAT